jgi:hypothetical protein
MLEGSTMNAPSPAPLPVAHIVKGEVVTGCEEEFGSGRARFATPKLDADKLVWSRREKVPAFDVPIGEIVDVLVATGDYLRRDPDGLLAQAAAESVRTNPLPSTLVERCYANLGGIFARESLEFQIRQELGGADILDGWREITTPKGLPARIRAVPPRLIHVIAGNAPGVAAQTLIRGALTKGVHLVKLPSNDLLTMPAVLRALAATAPGHPLTRSFSAVYWRGGDETVERALFRPQFFDKVVAWGGESTIRSAVKYLGPGFELVAFDPKSSISMVGREAFGSPETLAQAADRAAVDATILNQQACYSSRFQFVEGTAEQVDLYCEKLQAALGVDRPTATAIGNPPIGAIRDEISGLRDLDPLYRVWGSFDGRGVVIRSDEPVDFYPDAKVVNVVRVADLADALRYVHIATQTVGVFPDSRRLELRDLIASAGAQRITALGAAAANQAGLPHDGFHPLQRFVRWASDEG